MAESDERDRMAVWKDFADVVNMTPGELKSWLDSDESKEVGWTPDGEDESVGHQSGRRIIEIKSKKKADLSDDDYRHMRKVVGYAHRHLSQGGPDKDREHSPWRYSLMNWGHDPLKKGHAK